MFKVFSQQWLSEADPTSLEKFWRSKFSSPLPPLQTFRTRNSGMCFDRLLYRFLNFVFGDPNGEQKPVCIMKCKCFLPVSLAMTWLYSFAGRIFRALKTNITESHYSMIATYLPQCHTVPHVGKELYKSNGKFKIPTFILSRIYVLTTHLHLLVEKLSNRLSCTNPSLNLPNA